MGGHYWGALGYLLAGVMAALFIVIGINVIREWWWELGLGIAILIGMLSAFSEAPSFNVQSAQTELLEKFIEMDTNPSAWQLNAEERKLVSKGLWICNLQGLADISELASNLFKAEKYGPIMTLLDGLASSKDKPEKKCLDYYKEIKKTKPEAFALFDKHFPEIGNKKIE